MSRKIKYIALCLSILMLAPFSTDTFAKGKKHKGKQKHSQGAGRGKNFHAGAVYVLTNQTTNSVAVFRRDAKGMLSSAAEFPTGGSGNPTPQPPDPTTDPLASQGALIIGPGNQYLFAVNAGSNEISVLKINKDTLDIVDVADSGGVRPISLALHGDLLYVLNEGGTPNITGFEIEDDGTLTQLDDSTRPLIGGGTADPAQIGFSQDGDLLVVTDKAGNRLNTYTIDDDGLPSAPIDNASNGMTPFGFSFNNAGTLVVSEAFGGAPNQSAASSYEVADGGTLNVISGSVANSQTASCWVVITKNGKFVFISNTGSGTISSYSVSAGNGSLTLLDATAANTGMGSAPIDITLSVNSRILFVLLGGTRSVASYRIENNGALTQIDNVGGLPLGAQGIAAK
jgi:6-phosphogluconolactonase (cycloisomerase 2 family)